MNRVFDPLALVRKFIRPTDDDIAAAQKTVDGFNVRQSTNIRRFREQVLGAIALLFIGMLWCAWDNNRATAQIAEIQRLSIVQRHAERERDLQLLHVICNDFVGQDQWRMTLRGIDLRTLHRGSDPDLAAANVRRARACVRRIRA